MNLILELANYIGIIAFAISGSMKGIKKGMDLLGVLVLGFSTALGGGITADILLGIKPPTNLVYLPYPLTALLASFLTFLFYKMFTNVGKPLLYADAIGLGAFTASGASLAYSIDPSPLLVIMIGTITAVGGGVIRDMLSNEVPVILTREFYATAVIIGSGIYFLLRYEGESNYYDIIISFLITTVLRIIAMKLKWELPKVTNT
ncbi:trimeric intracellular cation channel family protein [Sulfurisphaera ohwakuensis]|uniref:Putative membrane protein YeiH n=1 Tax=Sulfurisphaera ohwakuensis TaxID=69656 RepID=A0A7J9RVA1_SULOH|nr:trimeric intracellular cation channel family protein [Sulfurisphaera ohwakuensis]MBB5254675.1 putative membrane protein YeiH [Sulfurisphaera ohwakuensis]